ncbi:relaxase/mobilization nuclease domain-containing protein [Massilia sp. R2A-15]|uniref:relaxase/mobilization nuclease domain-containing protein n=1 Tax=Massilia sp. R2A-15 TaxID=3064278 RepID=UPI002733464A|nr:relaxase/mobilization nuclease domain-containing protein [Massilia sp. R2A-15]WLI88539.1 relaxase/mobilization nuclease domain-containing protein [Massilia sp. R2A-15]
MNKEKGSLIDTNMEGADPRELAKEFGEIRKLRPKLGKAVLHVSLSAAPGEHLTDAQWTEIGQRYLHGMGLDDNQYLITRHDDMEHEHVHLLVNRIRFDGDVTSDSHDYRRHEVLMRAIERDYQLEPVHPSMESVRRAATKGEIEQGLRTGMPSTRQRLQQLC